MLEEPLSLNARFHCNPTSSLITAQLVVNEALLSRYVENCLRIAVNSHAGFPAIIRVFSQCPSVHFSNSHRNGKRIRK